MSDRKSEQNLIRLYLVRASPGQFRTVSGVCRSSLSYLGTCFVLGGTIGAIPSNRGIGYA